MTQGSGPTIQDYQTKIQEGEKYKLHLKSGQTLLIKVDSLDSEKVYGEVRGEKRYHYEETFESLQKNVSDISIQKMNYVVTTIIVISIPIIILSTTETKKIM